MEKGTDKTVVVTGGSRGIGAACVRGFAGAGWNVVLTYRSESDIAREVTRAVAAAGRRAVAVQADVSSEADVMALFGQVDTEFGPPDALVNNAGVAAAPSRVDELGAARIERILAVNVLGAFLCAREAVRRMSTRHGGTGGCIVNISSAATRIGSPGEYVDYAASKAAVETMTLGLAKEVGGEGIRVNAVRPGIIDTEIHARTGQPDKAQRVGATVPMGRAGTPGEVASAVVWLCEAESAYVNGAILDVTGGR
jgi:NAD(P)-dependent dehydrogenase (short-subunit alcohol dehydrogenase family)